MVAAFSKASQSALLIKDSAIFQNLYHADTVIFDKTGTLTKANQGISNFKAIDCTAAELFFAAKVCARASLHPISQAIFNACYAHFFTHY